MSALDIAIIDHWATSGRSVIHQAGAAAKVTWAACFIGAVVITSYLPLLWALYLAVAAVALAARVPVLKVLTVAAYPMIFAVMFVVAAWDGTWQMPALVLGRAMTAAATVVTLMATTPHPRVFALLSRVLPRIVAEALFLTYRAVFILADMAQAMITATQMRSGLSLRRPVTNLRNLAQATGKLLIHAIERAERQYDIMVVRGYDNAIAAPARAWNTLLTDAGPLIIGLAALAAALISRWNR